ncbi:MAG: hypothetical protein AB7F74_29275 [Parvibaculaceae bacterium]|jgi:hypothetical protein
MVPDELIKERRFKSATGPGVIIEAKGELKQCGVRRLISSVTVTISPVEVGSSLYRTHRQVVRPGSRRPSSTFDVGSRTLSDAKRMARIWIDQYVTTVHKPPPKIELIELGRYFQGGPNNEYRRVTAIFGEMVQYACWAGVGTCRDYSFAAWMKKRVDLVPDEEVKRIDERHEEFLKDRAEEHEFLRELWTLGQSIVKSWREERAEQDEPRAFSGP